MSDEKDNNRFDWSPSKARRIFTADQKLAATNLAKEVGLTQASIAFDIPRESIARFMSESGIKPEATRRGRSEYRVYSAEQRHSAVEAALEIGAGQASRDHGIPTPTLVNWLSQDPRYKPKRDLAKYTQEQRDQAVKLGIEVGAREASRKTGFPVSTINNWLPYKTPADRRSYAVHTVEVATAAADLALKTSIGEAAQTFGVSHSTVRTWRNRALGREPSREPVTPQRYDPGTKEAVLADVPTLGYAAAAAKHGVKRPLVGEWARAAGVRQPSRRGHHKGFDQELEWVARDYPQLADWRTFAIEWLASSTGAIGEKLATIRCLFVDYVIAQSLPTIPRELFVVGRPLPDFYKTACRQTLSGIVTNNYVAMFLDWTLESRHFRNDPMRGELRNPIPRIAYRTDNPSESVYPVLPYQHVLEMRQIIAAGRTFSDWKWAQSAMGSADGPGAVACWFEVDESKIDKSDPDCVYRKRYRSNAPPVLEMWSPVRWVALLFKLNVPHRPTQVRLLDSGEADTWRYENSNQTGSWSLNSGPLREGTETRPLRQGVFQRFAEDRVEEGGAGAPGHPNAILYFNTNKTDDRRDTNTRKGTETAWMNVGGHANDVFYWGVRLRNWQEKYNPVSRRTHWSELDGRHRTAKHRDVLKTYPAACFLFRTPEAGAGDAHFPLHKNGYNRPYYLILQEMETRQRRRVEPDSKRHIRLVFPDSKSKVYFPLYSTRTTLITVLLEDAGVPPHIVQRVVGHKRIAMLFHYDKISRRKVYETLQEGGKLLEASAPTSLDNFLADAHYDEIVNDTICNSTDAIASAIPRDAQARNALAWMRLDFGVCVVGGNTADLGDVKSTGGCYNGGPNIGSVSSPKYAPVPGGPRNCVRCRWLATAVQYLAALVAHLNALLFHHDAAAKACAVRESELTALVTRRATADAEDMPFGQQGELERAQKRFEKSLAKYSSCIADVAACYRLIKKCQQRLASGRESAVVLAGGPEKFDLEWVELPSELHQVHLVCEGAELYDDIEAEIAILTRSQLVDKALERCGAKPILFRLTTEQQLRVGNAFIRSLRDEFVLSHQGEAVEVLDVLSDSSRLGEVLGFDLSSHLETALLEMEG